MLPPRAATNEDEARSFVLVGFLGREGAVGRVDHVVKYGYTAGMFRIDPWVNDSLKP